MITLYMLDSERSWLEKVKNEAPWESCGCSLIGAASTVERCVTEIGELRPDVIITELEMPRLAGRELLQALRDASADSFIIVDSVRADFETAQAAIEFGVSSYLVKPLAIPALVRVVAHAARRIAGERRRQEMLESRTRIFRESADFFRAKVINALLAGRIRPEEMDHFAEHMRVFGANLMAGSYMAVEVESRNLSRQEGTAEKLARALSERFGEGAELAALTSDCVCGVLLGDGEEDLMRRAYIFAEQAVAHMSDAGAPGYVGLGDPVDRLEELRASAVQAQERLTAASRELRIVGPLERGHELEAPYLEPVVSLYETLCYTAPDGLKAAYGKYIESLQQLRLPESALCDYLRVEALLGAARIVQVHEPDITKVLPIQEYVREMRGGETLNQCAEDAFRLLEKAVVYRARLDDSIGNKGIAKARFFLDSHFSDPDLMLKDAAREAGMSSSRFSTVFAQEVHCTFTEYVTRLRIKKAKEMLAHTNLRISQIAAAVGYSDPHYFSWIFRKSEGCTPSECRDAAQDPED